jgi:streptogramin lyase
MVAGPDGQLWFADQRSPALFRMTTKGAVTHLWIPPGAPKAYESLGGLAVAPDGSVWVAQPWANKITRLSCRD